MKRTAVLTAAIAGCALLAPAAASAETYLTRAEAQNAARLVAVDRYPVEPRKTGAYCTLPGGRQPQRGYSYNRWSCTWTGESLYSFSWRWGQLRIIGRPGWGNYRYSVLRGMGRYSGPR